MTLKAVYVNRNGHRLMPYHIVRGAGAVNDRVHCHNFTTGYDEAWSTRLFLAEHVRESEVTR